MQVSARVSGYLKQIFLLQSFLRETPGMDLMLDMQFLSMLLMSNSFYVSFLQLLPGKICLLDASLLKR